MTDREKRVVAIFCWERRDKTGDTQETIAKSLEMKQQHVGRIISNWRERADTEDRRKGNQRPAKYDFFTVVRKLRRQLREKKMKVSFRGLAKSILKDKSKNRTKR